MIKAGDVVEAGKPLMILEAMKMEHVIRAPRAGKIDKIMFKVGDIVGQNKLLLSMKD